MTAQYQSDGAEARRGSARDLALQLLFTKHTITADGAQQTGDKSPKGAVATAAMAAVNGDGPQQNGERRNSTSLLRREIESLQDENQELLYERRQLSTELESVRASQARTFERIAELESDRQVLLDDISELREELAQQQEKSTMRISLLTDDSETLRVELVRREREVVHLRSAVAALSKAITVVHQDRAGLQERLEQATASLVRSKGPSPAPLSEEELAKVETWFADRNELDRGLQELRYTIQRRNHEDAHRVALMFDYKQRLIDHVDAIRTALAVVDKGARTRQTEAEEALQRDVAFLGKIMLLLGPDNYVHVPLTDVTSRLTVSQGDLEALDRSQLAYSELVGAAEGLVSELSSSVYHLFESDDADYSDAE